MISVSLLDRSLVITDFATAGPPCLARRYVHNQSALPVVVVDLVSERLRLLVVAAWRPGEEGGSAIVNLLLGDVNPSGKLAQASAQSIY